MMANGSLWDAAMAGARAFAIKAIVTDIALVNRAALDAASKQLSPKPAAWVRIAGPSACGFCSKTAGQLVSRPQVAPLHPNCSCTLEAVWKTDRRVPVVKPKPTDQADYTVSDHGELGAIPQRVPESLGDI
jgi:hypothetical protein